MMMMMMRQGKTWIAGQWQSWLHRKLMQRSESKRPIGKEKLIYCMTQFLLFPFEKKPDD